MTKSDPINIALVALVFMNVLAVLQFHTLTSAGPSQTYKASTADMASDHVGDAVGPAGAFIRGDHPRVAAN
jgi:hypothetical protein